MSTPFASPFGRLLACLLVLLFLFNTVCLGIVSYLIHGAQGGSSGLSIWTIICFAYTTLFAVVPYLVVPYFAPRSSLFQTRWVLLTFGFVFVYWLAAAIAWVVEPTQRYGYLVYCIGDKFWFITFLTRCSILRALQVFHWLSFGAAAGLFVGLLTAACVESRKGHRDVWRASVYEYFARSRKANSTQWKEVHDTTHGPTSTATGGRSSLDPHPASGATAV